jgi:uncharacterized protein (DUF39 family)
MLGYGTSLTTGIGIPIPILDEEICRFTAIRDEEIYAQVVDYSQAYPQLEPEVVGEVNYAQLKSGSITLQGKRVPTGALSSYSRAKEIACELKSWIEKGEFQLTEALAPLPRVESGYCFKALRERPL